MMANSRNIDLAVGSDLGQARPDAWHLWCVLIPRRSITGRLVWGTVWRRDRGGRWVYKKVIEHSDGGELETRLPDRGTVSLPASVRIRLQRGKKLRKLITCETSDIEFIKLRISRAYIKLLCIPDGVEKIVSLARIGNYEVRMFESSQTGSDAVQLFSMELFDHAAQSPVDSCICYSLDEGVVPSRISFRDEIIRSRFGKERNARLRGSIKCRIVLHFGHSKECSL